MLKILRSMFNSNAAAPPERATADHAEQAPSDLLLPEGNLRFPFSEHLNSHQGLPIVDWTVVQSWVDGIESEDLQAKAWAQAEKAWLLHLRDSLGEKYRVMQSDTALLLSALDKNVAQATLEYMSLTLKRISKVLDGIADIPPWGSDILIVFENEELYYDYVSFYYPEPGEYAFSSGMFINAGCSHFVAVQSDLRVIEPVIAHEMTHSCLSHLPIPLWLNEGLAVNTEQRLTGKPPNIYSDREMREKHLAFWDAEKIQEFWSGKSFSRTDEGNMLSYDLARILVEQFSKDWASFKDFVLAAQWQDGGAEGAKRYLGIRLGEYTSALLEKPSADLFEPLKEDPINQHAAANGLTRN
jgi:hypothetical protein